MYKNVIRIIRIAWCRLRKGTRESKFKQAEVRTTIRSLKHLKIIGCCLEEGKAVHLLKIRR